MPNKIFRRDYDFATRLYTRATLAGMASLPELRNGDRSVDVYVSKLRVKLEAAMPDRRFIHTDPGFGYRFQPQPAREPEPARMAMPAEVESQHLSRDVHIGAPGA